MIQLHNRLNFTIFYLNSTININMEENYVF